MRLPGARGARLVSTLRAQLRAIGYEQDRVVIRTFESERLPIAARTGHDRTADSRLWDYPMDSSAATRRAAGIEDWQVTYAHEVDLRGGDPSILIPEGNEFNVSGRTSLTEHLSRLDDIDGVAIAVYRADRLQRATTRKGKPSLAEFWFRTPPRDALLMIIEKPRAPAPRRTLDLGL
ncbi:MAG TPA: hypothetical protein VKZ63_06815 [Kofleriaceae bacterium]|nr:hypothetical protein [Kofleriaceae bacterium]